MVNINGEKFEELWELKEPWDIAQSDLENVITSTCVKIVLLPHQ
jgi:hypothetical protein